MDIDEVRAALEAAVDKIGGQRLWARAHKISVPYVSRVLSGTKPPGPKLLKALGLIKVQDYQPRKVNGR